MAAYEVTNVSEEQVPDPQGSGDLIDVFDITLTIEGHPGSFTVQVPEHPDPVTAAYQAAIEKAGVVNAIYAGSSGGA